MIECRVQCAIGMWIEIVALDQFQHWLCHWNSYITTCWCLPSHYYIWHLTCYTLSHALGLFVCDNLTLSVSNLQQYLTGGDYDDVEDLEEKLTAYKSESSHTLRDCVVTSIWIMWSMLAFLGQFMEFDEDNSGDIGECTSQCEHEILAFKTGSFKITLSLVHCSLGCTYHLHRHHGVKENDGEVGTSQDPFGTEEDDSWSRQD